MMVDNLNLTTVISQIPDAQKIHQPQLTHPEAQQALAQEMALKRQKMEQKQVVRAEPSTRESEVDPEGHQNPSRDSHPGPRKKRMNDLEPESDQGRLIDVQV
jgi:hypothetical protein